MRLTLVSGVLALCLASPAGAARRASITALSVTWRNVGAQRRIFADPRGVSRTPVIVVVTQVSGHLAQAFLNLNTPGATDIGKGDFVEPVTLKP